MTSESVSDLIKDLKSDPEIAAEVFGALLNGMESDAKLQNSLISFFLNALLAALETAADISVTRATSTRVTGGFNVQVAANFNVDQGEELASPPNCELFSHDLSIHSQQMEQVYGQLWIVDFQGVYPEPNYAKLSADFFTSAGGVESITKVVTVPHP